MLAGTDLPRPQLNEFFLGQDAPLSAEEQRVLGFFDELSLPELALAPRLPYVVIITIWETAHALGIGARGQSAVRPHPRRGR
jgi:hypothetical protein